jgi:hypothetical protein
MNKAEILTKRPRGAGRLGVVIMTATLLLPRPFRSADLVRTYQIVLDGKPAGELLASSSVTLPARRRLPASPRLEG